MIKAINTYAIPVLTYSFGVIKWSISDIQDVERCVASWQSTVTTIPRPALRDGPYQEMKVAEEFDICKIFTISKYKILENTSIIETHLCTVL